MYHRSVIILQPIEFRETSKNIDKWYKYVMQADIRKPAKTPRRKKDTEQLSGAMDLFASPKRQKTDGERSFLISSRMFYIVQDDP